MMAQDRAGGLIEYDLTSRVFAKPQDERAEQYMTGRFGLSGVVSLVWHGVQLVDRAGDEVPVRDVEGGDSASY